MRYKTVFGWTPVRAPTSIKWEKVKDKGCRGFEFDSDEVIKQVNRLVNKRISYAYDREGDIWSPPEETLKRGFGDCEDFALLKRALLLQQGIPDEEIIFLIVNDLIAHQFHAVLLLDGVILDCYNSLLLPEEDVRDYIPVRAFCGSHAYIFGHQAFGR